MQELLIKAGCFIAIIILGYFLKRINFFHKDDFHLLSKIVIRITAPCAIIVSFAGKEFDPSMLTLGLLGFGAGVLYIALGYLINLRHSKEQKAFDIVNLPGYNIGNFTLPFVQSFLGPVGVITTSLFDTGNAVITLGGAYGIAATVKDGSGFSVKRIVKGLMHSVPFVCYIILVVLALLHISIPEPVVSLAQTIANGNVFLAMLMIGVGFELSGDRKQIGAIAKVLVIRYAVAAVLAVGAYCLLPFSLEIRQTLVLLVFSPMPTMAPAFTDELGGDIGLSSAINSISIICSITIMVVLMSIML